MGMAHFEVPPLSLLALILLFGFIRWIMRQVRHSRVAQDQPNPKAPRPLKPKSGYSLSPWLVIPFPETERMR